LVSADETITEVARDLRTKSQGAAAKILDLFLEGYPEQQVTKVMTVYLACFSAARDDTEQWRKYADYGRGLCLGLRVINESVPKDPNVGSALLKVDYSESSWRNTVANSFKRICLALSRAEVLPTLRNFKLGLSALYRIAAFASISAKRPQWEVEQEFRHATILHPDTNLRSLTQISSHTAVSAGHIPDRVIKHSGRACRKGGSQPVAENDWRGGKQEKLRLYWKEGTGGTETEGTREI
jgi:hypothetical protein